MRAGPLSQEKVIGMLNSSFVPVYVTMQDVEGDGKASAEEKAEVRRIFLETRALGSSTGTVHVYVLAPDARVLGSLHVQMANAQDGSALIDLLERTAKELKVTPGKALVAPRAQSER